MLLVSISTPPLASVEYDRVVYEGPLFDVPKDLAEMWLGRPDIWRKATSEEADGAPVDHTYDGRNENFGRPEHLHDGRPRRRGAEALAELPVPTAEATELPSDTGEPGLTTPVNLDAQSAPQLEAEDRGNATPEEPDDAAGDYPAGDAKPTVETADDGSNLPPTEIAGQGPDTVVAPEPLQREREQPTPAPAKKTAAKKTAAPRRS